MDEPERTCLIAPIKQCLSIKRWGIVQYANIPFAIRPYSAGLPLPSPPKCYEAWGRTGTGMYTAPN